ncbi:putative carbonic anhydrase [Candidatus Protochlamydia naegleriophila]|uniref:carbonic anhydrase n=1 Tax=Candidatus Protochlamydia naegleriophila TaxID=389348 RepID=A0A0U5CPQ8_9BACT|nr:carbonic anhydrase [Candidatus Protochlamydia naegleriophila]CUI16748.1 putative carbonic anhydrase [Candidatus Protochlamydia naegleriophila]
MKKLIQGIVDFRKNLTEESRTLFAKLALGQKPDSLFIACSDSRVVPNLFASTNPGDLFVLRNIGNLIPPLSDSAQDSSASAVIEFSLFSLNVSDIIVCGHSECGAMRALVEGVEFQCCPHLESWLKYGEEAVKKVREGLIINPALSEQNQVSQVNVLQQMEHLKTYPFVRERLEKKELRIHGWWFDIAQADVYCYEQELNQFILIDEKEAELILGRANNPA